MKRMLVGVVACALALSGCARTPDDVPVFTPTPIGAPSASPTPTQAELSAMAEATYRAFFAEWTRLEREGGANEPTQVMLDNATDGYLDGVMSLLRQQKQDPDYQVTGPIPTAHVVAAPGGDFAGIDPRLTLRVCEDASTSTFTVDGAEHRGYRVQGTVYLRFAGDRPKLVAGTTQRVDSCDI